MGNEDDDEDEDEDDVDDDKADDEGDDDEDDSRVVDEPSIAISAEVKGDLKLVLVAAPSSVSAAKEPELSEMVLELSVCELQRKTRNRRSSDCTIKDLMTGERFLQGVT